MTKMPIEALFSAIQSFQVDVSRANRENRVGSLAQQEAFNAARARFKDALTPYGIADLIDWTDHTG